MVVNTKDSYRWLIGAMFVAVATAMSLWYSSQNHSEPDTHKELKVVVDASFFSEYGPGEEIADLFFKVHDIKVRYLPLADPNITLQRLKTDKSFAPDVIVGLDAFLLEDWESEDLWIEQSIDSQSFRKELFPWLRANAVPIDWAPLALIANDVASLKSWNDLTLRHPKSIVTPSPKSSVPGVYLLWWLSAVADYQKIIKEGFKFVAPDWNSAFELFKQGGSKYFFTYVTSISFFGKENAKFKIETLGSAVPLQVEFAVVPKVSSMREESKQFVQFLLKPESQKLLVDKNYMISVTSGMDSSQISSLVKIPQLSHANFLLFNKDRKKWLEQYSSAYRD